MERDGAVSKGARAGLTGREDHAILFRVMCGLRLGESRMILKVKFVVPGTAAILLFGAQIALGDGLFGRKDKIPQPPQWCFCARVCQQSQWGIARRDAPGDPIAQCPRLHDEVIYDNRARCNCAGIAKPEDTEPRRSPNH